MRGDGREYGEGDRVQYANTLLLTAGGMYSQLYIVHMLLRRDGYSEECLRAAAGGRLARGLGDVNGAFLAARAAGRA